MKKSISLILALILLLFVFTGCGSGGTDEVGGTVSTPAATGTPSENPEDEGKEIDLGEISGGAVYTNNFAGITFTLPEGWSFATEEELADMMSAGAEDIFADDKQALVEYAMESTVYDMMAYSANGSTNVMVMFENTSRYLVGAFMSVDKYLDALEENFKLVQDFTYKVEGRSDLKLGDTDYRCLSTIIEEYGVYQDYVVRREGKYMICLAFTGSEANPASAMGEWFS